MSPLSHRNELLHALSGIDLAGVKVARRIHGGDVEKMKLPAGMSVRDVMSRVQDGQTVSLDGTQGVVRLE